MNLPKVKFVKLSVKENLEELLWYANFKNSIDSPVNFYESLLEIFPELKGKITYNMSIKEIHLVLEKYVKPILENLYNNSKDTENYQKIWDSINDEIMLDLQKRLDIKWKEDTKITCKIGLLPVCPREIESFTYCVNYNMDKDTLIAISIHEICHFLYFEKWKEIQPNYKKEEFDSPHISWYLSEAFIDPLINNKVFKKYTSEDLLSYSYFYKTYINGKSIIDILKEYIDNYPINEAIIKGYQLFKKYEKIIKKTN